MKKLYLICLLMFFFVQMHAQIIATTATGRKVILYANGNWRYANGNSSRNGSTDASALYNEAYKYAYDVVYGDEFFSNERRNKSILWAKDYVSKNLYIPIGSRTLEQWYNDLYEFANTNFFKDIIFSPDRKKESVLWVEQTLKDKAYFEDYDVSIIERHRIAYDVAYKYIYQQEFFDSDRKKMARQWANEFVRR